MASFVSTFLFASALISASPQHKGQPTPQTHTHTQAHIFAEALASTAWLVKLNPDHCKTPGTHTQVHISQCQWKIFSTFLHVCKVLTQPSSAEDFLKDSLWHTNTHLQSHNGCSLNHTVFYFSKTKTRTVESICLSYMWMTLNSTHVYVNACVGAHVCIWECVSVKCLFLVLLCQQLRQTALLLCTHRGNKITAHVFSAHRQLPLLSLALCLPPFVLSLFIFPHFTPLCSSSSPVSAPFSSL